MFAGVDFGTTVTKFAWRDDEGDLVFHTTAGGNAGPFPDEKDPQRAVMARLRVHGIDRLRATGIGPRWFRALPLDEPSGDPIGDEIELQAEGVRALTPAAERDRPRLIVSIGTGTSYTVARKGTVARFPLGNAIGGGFIAGLARLSDIDVESGALGPLAALGAPMDLLVKDLVPSKAGGPEGEFVVAHFGRVAKRDPADGDDAGPNPAAIAATIVHCAAVTVIRDVMLIGMVPPFSTFEEVVCIGTSISRVEPLRAHLSRYAAMLGLPMRFPANGEFSAAVGALLAAEKA